MSLAIHEHITRATLKINNGQGLYLNNCVFFALKIVLGHCSNHNNQKYFTFVKHAQNSGGNVPLAPPDAPASMHDFKLLKDYKSPRTKVFVY